MKQEEIIRKNLAAMVESTKSEPSLKKLMEFEGWGRCPALIDPNSEETKVFRYGMSEFCVKADRESMTDKVTKQALAQAQSSTLTSYYTPVDIATSIRKGAEYIFEKLNGRKAATMLEPSAGTGNFLHNNPVADEITTYECDGCTVHVLNEVITSLGLDVHRNFSSFGKASWDERFDLIVSNIPFGDVSVYDDSKLEGLYYESTKRIHNYYFMKCARLLNVGGILAFITSRGFWESQDNRKYRDELMKYCSVVDMTRLPDNMFPTIDVGTDLIVLYKGKMFDRMNGAFLFGTGGVPVQSEDFLLPNTEIKEATNRFGQPTYKYRHDKETIAMDILKKLRKAVGLYTEDVIEDAVVVEEIKDEPHHWWSLFFFFDDEDEETPQQPKQPKAKKRYNMVSIQEWIKDSVPFMQKAYDRLMEDTTNEECRNDMKEVYDNMLQLTNEKYGKEIPNFHHMVRYYGDLLDDQEVQFLHTLEQRDADGNYIPADIFYKDVLKVEDRTDLNAAEVLAMSLNMCGKVDMRFMMEHSGMDQVQLAEQLRGSMFFNPITGCYEEADRWLSGNVVDKAAKAEKCLPNYKDGQLKEAEEAVLALKAARPMAVQFNDIDVNFGARWVPIDYYKQFICHVFEGTRNDLENMTLFYIPTTDQYVGSTGLWGHQYYHSWKVKNTSADEMMLSALQGSIPKFMKKDENDPDKQVIDEEATTQAARVIEEIRRLWRDWVNTPDNAKMREHLQQIYNDRFNNEVRPKYDGSFQTFPGLCLGNLGIKELYASQKDAIWMIKRNGGGVCWHEVGTGKTLIMCIAAYEMKRIGMVNKPVIIGLKANIGQIAETFRKAYPDAKILHPKSDNFSKENRLELFNQIKNNDWDCIIMTHDQFGMIPQAAQTEERLAEEEIESLYDIINEIDAKGGRRWQIIRNLQKRIERMKIKLDKLKTEVHKDMVMDFREMGIDHIFVDESHQYKNLPFTTRNERVGGIGNPTGSKKAWQLLTAIRDIQDRTGRDLGATFLSGTVVSNSLTELYLIFKYLRPNALREQGIHSFDAWAAIFCELTRDFEVNVVGKLRSKERFSAYVNLPELAQFLRQITDYRTASMVGLDVPEAVQHFENAKPTPNQVTMLDRMVKFVDNKNWESLGIQKERPCKSEEAFRLSIMLIATDLARKVSLDPRLLDDCKTFGDELGNKVRRCAENVYRIWLQTKEHKGTQFVFTDTSTYDAGKWNMQSAVRDILVEQMGVPAHEIAFINNASTDKKRLELFNKMNNGDVRVLFGSTTKLGTGVNAQQRCVAVHHLDIPWRPSDLEQRNGRAIRKGNEVKLWGGNKVDIFIYATERTLDAYKFNLLKNKQQFIDQLNNGTLGLRRIDESVLQDGDQAVSYAEFLSILTGNDDLLKKAKLDAKIMALEKDKTMWQRNRNSMVEKISQYEKANESDGEWVRNARIDYQQSEDVTEDTPMIVEGKEFADRKEMGKAIIHVADTYTRHEYKECGSYGSLKMVVVRDEQATNADIPQCTFYIVGKTGQYYRACQGMIRTGHITTAGGVEHAGRFPFDTRKQLLAEIEMFEKKIAEREAQLPSMREFIKKEWGGEAELRQFHDERDKVMASIAEQEKRAA